MSHTNLADALKAWRHSTGKTQQEAADDLGVSLRTFHGWENNAQPAHDRLVRLAISALNGQEANA